MPTPRGAAWVVSDKSAVMEGKVGSASGKMTRVGHPRVGGRGLVWKREGSGDGQRWGCCVCPGMSLVVICKFLQAAF